MKTTKNFTILLAILALTMPGAESRTFTNTAGKRIEAELIGMEDGAAMLKLGNGRKAKVLLTSLSEADQAYVKTWYEENKNNVSENDLELTIKKKTKRIGSSSSNSSISSSSSNSSGDDNDNDNDDGGGCRRRGGGGNRSTSKSSESETIYTCTLKNSSTQTVEGMEATYTIYKRVSTRGDGGSENRTAPCPPQKRQPHHRHRALHDGSASAQ